MKRKLAATGMVLMGLVCVMVLSCEKERVEQVGACGAVPVLAADSLSLEEYEADIRILAKDQAKLITYQIPRDTLHHMMLLTISPDHYVTMCSYLDAIDDTQDSTILALIGEMRSIQAKYATLCTFRISRPFECLNWNGASAVPVFYVGPWDESQTTAVYAYDADGNELTLSVVNPPDIVVLGMEGFPTLANAGGSGDGPVRPPQTDVSTWYWVMRIGEMEIYHDKEPWHRGTPEIATRIVYDRSWPTWYWFDSRVGGKECNAPGDDCWDIFLEVDAENHLYSFWEEFHYNSIARCIYAGEQQPKYYIQLLEQDWPDCHDKLIDILWIPDSPIRVRTPDARMWLQQDWESHVFPWAPDNYPND